MMMRLLGQILAQAVKDKVRDDNPARDPDLKIRVPKPARTFLEIDQLVVLLDAAHYLQTSPRSSKRAKLTREQAAEIRARLKLGETQHALRHEYGLERGVDVDARAGQDLHREERPHRLARGVRDARLRRPPHR